MVITARTTIASKKNEKAFIFPGQGSQAIGMGKDFFDIFPIAKETFQLIDDTLKLKLSDIIFNGPNDILTLTVNTQPALMAVSIAILNVIKEQTNKDITDLCAYLAGHSLGEYSALCAAGSISAHDTAKLLRIRGQSMQEACKVGSGGMVACIGIDIQKLENICNTTDTQIANDNIEGQLVISGLNENLDRVMAILKDLGYKAIKLKVSAPFHCNLMKPAEYHVTEALSQTIIYQPLVPVIANVTAKATTNPIDIRQNLILQVCGRVRWRETLDELAKLGITEIIEIGSGKVLTGMLKKTTHTFKLTNVGNISEFEAFCELLSH